MKQAFISLFLTIMFTLVLAAPSGQQPHELVLAGGEQSMTNTHASDETLVDKRVAQDQVKQLFDGLDESQRWNIEKHKSKLAMNTKTPRAQ